MKYRLVRTFGKGMTPATEKAYRVETSELLSEKEALELMEKLGSPYKGQRLNPNWVANQK